MKKPEVETLVTLSLLEIVMLGLRGFAVWPDLIGLRVVPLNSPLLGHKLLHVF
jgi:hypothetical protein